MKKKASGKIADPGLHDRVKREMARLIDMAEDKMGMALFIVHCLASVEQMNPDPEHMAAVKMATFEAVAEWVGDGGGQKMRVRAAMLTMNEVESNKLAAFITER